MKGHGNRTFFTEPFQKKYILQSTVPTWALVLIAGPGNDGGAGAVGSVELCLPGNPALAAL